MVVTVVEFEAVRPQLIAIAFRLLGSIHDAEDAVQNTWIKAAATNTDKVRNPSAWLTTVLTRLCLDQQRMVRRRREEPILTDLLPAESVAADERYLQREEVSRALMVVLNNLTPDQRVAYVLHDLFDVPFRDIAKAIGCSADNAKKHASRARTRLRQTEIAPPAPTVDNDVVEAFIAASSGGDMQRMLDLMTEDCERVADTTLIPLGTSPVVTGRHNVAKETVLFADRIRVSTPMLVNGHPGYVIAPGGHPLAIINFTTRKSRVAQIDIARLTHAAFEGVPSTS